MNLLAASIAGRADTVRELIAAGADVPWVVSQLRAGDIVTHMPTANGMGIVVLSTSRGVMSDREARAQGVGGEILCEVW